MFLKPVRDIGKVFKTIKYLKSIFSKFFTIKFFSSLLDPMVINYKTSLEVALLPPTNVKKFQKLPENFHTNFEIINLIKLLHKKWSFSRL